MLILFIKSSYFFQHLSYKILLQHTKFINHNNTQGMKYLSLLASYVKLSIVSYEQIIDGNCTFAPGSKSSIGGTSVLWNFRSMELLFHGTFVPWNFRSREQKWRGTFILLVQKLPLTALMVIRYHKTSFPVRHLLKLVGLHVWCGLVKQSWAGIKAAGIIKACRDHKMSIPLYYQYPHWPHIYNTLDVLL